MALKDGALYPLFKLNRENEDSLFSPLNTSALQVNMNTITKMLFIWLIFQLINKLARKLMH